MAEREYKVKYTVDTGQSEESLKGVEDQLKKTKTSAEGLGQGSQTALGALGEAANRAGRSTQGLGTAAGSAVNKVKDVAGAAGNLVGIFGRAVPEASKFGSAIGAIGPALGGASNAAGVFGIALTAITVGASILVPLFESLETASYNASHAFDKTRLSIVELAASLAQKSELDKLREGLTEVTRQEQELERVRQIGAASTRQLEEAQAQYREALEEYTAAEIAHAENTQSNRGLVGVLAVTERRLHDTEAQLQSATVHLRTFASANDAATLVIAEQVAALDRAREAEERLRQARIEGERIAYEVINTVNEAIRDTEREAQQASQRARQRREEERRAREEMRNNELQAIAQFMQSEIQLQNEADEHYREALFNRTQTYQNFTNAIIEQQLIAGVAAQQAQQQATEHNSELVHTSQEAAYTFQNSWTQGVDATIAAFTEANNAARAAGEEQISIMEGMATVAKAAGDTIAKDLLGTLASGFAEAIKAVVKGEKSFEKAMLGMLESTLYSVGTQATVKAILEYAEAIAAFAREDYKTGPMHLIAAGIYTAAAVAAFAGGAAVTAASGGSAGATPPSNATQAPSASSSNNSNNQGGGTTNIFLQNDVLWNEEDTRRNARRRLNG